MSWVTSGLGVGSGSRNCHPRIEEDANRSATAVHAVAVTSDGFALRFSLEPLVEPSTRTGRRFARPAEGAEIVGVARVTGKEILIAATTQARGLLCQCRRGELSIGSRQGRAF